MSRSALKVESTEPSSEWPPMASMPGSTYRWLGVRDSMSRLVRLRSSRRCAILVLGRTHPEPERVERWEEEERQCGTGGRSADQRPCHRAPKHGLCQRN